MTQHAPVFSVITVTYNASRWLESTILSVLNQSYPQIEYLIIDGGSTDGTVDIIKQYEAGLAYWISEPDKGLYDAMNKGLQQATGDYVWFINAGDTIYTADTVQKIVNSLKKKVSLPDIIYGDTMMVDARGRSLGLRRLRPPKKLTWKSFKMGMLVCHQSFIAKREIVPAYDVTYKLVSDYDWTIQSLKNAKDTHDTHLVLTNFLEAGLSSVNRKVSLQERYEIMAKYYGAIPTFFRHIWFAMRFYWAKLFKGRV